MKNTCTILLPYVRMEDPHLCTDAHALLVLRRLMFDSLLSPAAGGPAPGLADRWEQGDQGRLWTFHIKEGVYFDDGSELTSADVVYSLKRAASPEVSGQLFTVTFHEYIGSAEIYAPDRFTVVLKNPDPLADLEELLYDLAIIQEGSDGSSAGGTGAYKPVDWGEGYAVLSLKEDSPLRNSMPETLRVEAEADPVRRTEALRSGRADMVLDPPMEEVAALQKSEHTGVFGWDTSLSVIFFISCAAPPMKDPRVRQALNLVVDVPRLIREITFGHAKPLNGPFSDRHFAHDPSLEPYPCDPEKARRLLEESGLKEGFPLSVHAPTTIPEEGPALADYICAACRNVGINASVVLHSDRTAYARDIAEKKLEGLCCFDSSPLSSYKVLHEKLDSRFAGTWWQGYHNDEVNSLITLAASTCNTAERRDIYRRIYRILHEEAPWVFLYQARRFWAFSGTEGPPVKVDAAGYFRI